MATNQNQTGLRSEERNGAWDFYPYNHSALILRDGDLAVLSNSLGRLCGYCAFTPDEIPMEWHGDYDVDALQYLSIHGGLTYCEVHGNNDKDRHAAAKAAQEAVARPAETADLDARMDGFRARWDAGKAACRSVPYTHIVFGFDCAHYRDEENPALSDPQHVLGLARQMRTQIAAYAKVINQWRAADRETRMAMVDEIRNAAATGTELGFTALIGALAGAKAFGEEQAS